MGIASIGPVLSKIARLEFARLASRRAEIEFDAVALG